MVQLHMLELGLLNMPPHQTILPVFLDTPVTENFMWSCGKESIIITEIQRTKLE